MGLNEVVMRIKIFLEIMAKTRIRYDRNIFKDSNGKYNSNNKYNF